MPNEIATVIINATKILNTNWNVSFLLFNYLISAFVSVFYTSVVTKYDVIAYKSNDTPGTPAIIMAFNVKIRIALNVPIPKMTIAII